MTTLCGSRLQSYNACPTVQYSIDIGSVSVFTVQIDDTSDETNVSATASVWLILSLCASLVCMLCSSKLVIVVVSLKEVCEFIITYNCMFLCCLLVPLLICQFVFTL